MDSLFGFGVDVDLASASSSRSSVATEISSASLNFRTFVLPGDGFLLDGERGEGDDDDAGDNDDDEGDDEDDAPLAPPPLGLRLVATTRPGEAKGAGLAVFT